MRRNRFVDRNRRRWWSPREWRPGRLLAGVGRGVPRALGTVARRGGARLTGWVRRRNRGEPEALALRALYPRGFGPLPRRWRRGLGLTALLLLLLQGAGWLVAQRENSPVPPIAGAPGPTDQALRAANAELAAKLRALRPTGLHLVVDTAANRVYLRRNDEVVREMLASCGSGHVLEDRVGGRRWVFETPRGQFRIKSKITDPLWIKPDWAFLEEGEPIPANPAQRAEYGMMGDYALGLGDGYFIHGTLYTRMLGRNVSHGCVRLGDEDLATLYRSVPLGTRVFIF